MQGSHLEQVVKVSTKKAKSNSTEEDNSQPRNSSIAWEADPSGAESEAKEAPPKKENVEQDVDRLIDSESNEYVLSRPKGGIALTLDPLLVQVRALAGS
jgi:hypothetical protein